MTSTTINVENIIGGVNGIEAQDGQKIYDLILKAFLDNIKVILSFNNIEMLTDEFLDTAIGQLYKYYMHDEIKENMSIEDISFTGKLALKKIVDAAKMINADPSLM
ncbi:MAG: STAS-like domain-containing protein [Candidatus Saccharimonadaceae bacterium]